MRADVENAKNFKFLTKSFVNEGSIEDFLKKTTLYIVFQLYKMK